MSRLPAVRGYRRATALGFLAAVLGYAATYALRSSAVQMAVSSGEYGAMQLSAWKLAGWLFASAHHVPVRSYRGPVHDAYLMPAGASFGPSWSPVLFAVPVVLLVAAGALAAGRPAEQRDGARRGAAVALGYLPLAAVSLYAFRHSGRLPEEFYNQAINVVLEPVATVVLMGVAFPVVFGALGGVLQYELRAWRR